MTARELGWIRDGQVPPTVAIGPRNLANEPHSLVGEGSCRVVAAPSSPRRPSPVTALPPRNPRSPFSSAKPVRVQLGSIDVRAKAVRITPRQLSSLGDGSHPLKVNGKSTSLVLAPCLLSASVAGSGDSQVRYAALRGDRHQERLHQDPKTRDRRRPRRPRRGDCLRARRSPDPVPPHRTEDLLQRHQGPPLRHTVRFRHLPEDTGTVEVDLKHGLVQGTGGKAKAAATLKGGLAARAGVRTLWK